MALQINFHIAYKQMDVIKIIVKKMPFGKHGTMQGSDAHGFGQFGQKLMLPFNTFLIVQPGNQPCVVDGRLCKLLFCTADDPTRISNRTHWFLTQALRSFRWQTDMSSETGPTGQPINSGPVVHGLIHRIRIPGHFNAFQAWDWADPSCVSEHSFGRL